jgi:hypothetical protein
MNPDATLIFEREFLFFSSLERVGSWRTRLSAIKGEGHLKGPSFRIFHNLFSLHSEKTTHLDKFLRLIHWFFPGW